MFNSVKLNKNINLEFVNYANEFFSAYLFIWRKRTGNNW